MIRRPSRVLALLKWHRDYMNGKNPPRHDGWPECGWYKMRRVKDGPWIPVTIWCQQDTEPDEDGLPQLVAPERLRADAWGRAVSAAEIWTHVRPISKAEYDELLAYRMGNQHRLDDDRSIRLDLEPTPPQG